jgi:hypothetical protein
MLARLLFAVCAALIPPRLAKINSEIGRHERALGRNTTLPAERHLRIARLGELMSERRGALLDDL